MKMIVFKKSIKSFLIVISVICFLLSCSNIDNDLEQGQKQSVVKVDFSSAPLMVNDIIVFTNIDVPIQLAVDDQKVALSSDSSINLNTMSTGWHRIDLLSHAADSLLGTYYLNKIEGTPNVLVSNKTIEEGRMQLYHYSAKRYKEYLQETYTVSDSYFGSYHNTWVNMFDDEGIPIDIREGKVYYNPTGIAQYALSFYASDMSREDSIGFFKNADFLCKSLNEEGGFAYDFDFDMRGVFMKAPWYSGMAQGQILSVLSRAYKLTNDYKYLYYGNKVLNFMIADPGDSYPKKGCKVLLRQFSDIHENLKKFQNYVIYDEYVDDECTYVLNGNLFGLVGLHDYYEVSNSQIAYNAFDEGIKSIKVMLPYYDYYGATSYDLLHFLSNTDIKFNSPYAHDYDISLLDAIYKYTGDSFFAKYRDSFISYYASPFMNY